MQPSTYPAITRTDLLCATRDCEPIQCRSSKAQYLQSLGIESHSVASDGAQRSVTRPTCSVLTSRRPIDQPAELTQHINVAKHLPGDSKSEAVMRKTSDEL